jgi:hypothetical protein
MRTIAEQNLLLRVPIELPEGPKLLTDEFCEGWAFARSVDARHMEQKIHTRGWHFIRIADATLRSGVGETAQAAIASALKLTLRRVSHHFNAAEVEHIDITQYPWFFLARIRIYPFRIQQGAALPDPGKFEPIPITSRPRRLPSRAAALYPQFGSAVPMLKEALTSYKGSRAEIQ